VPHAVFPALKRRLGGCGDPCSRTHGVRRLRRLGA